MTDMNRVSADVQQRVKTVMQQEGKKNKIDSQAEFEALQQLANELKGRGASAHEQNYVEGLMIDYQKAQDEAAAKAEAKQQRAQISDAARKDLANIKKQFPDKKELNETEARMVLDLIKNTRGDYNAAEIEYFKQELMKAGFGDLLNEQEAVKQEPKPVQPEPPEEQPPVENETLEEPPVESEPEPTGEPSKPVEPKPTDIPPKTPRSKFNPVNPVKTSPVEEKPPVDSPKTEPPKDKPLTQKEKMEANQAGYDVAKAIDEDGLFSSMSNHATATTVDYTTHRLTGKNYAEFMKGCKKAGVNEFYRNLCSDGSFKDRYSVAKQTALKMAAYLKQNPTPTSQRDITVINGIIAQNDYNNEQNLKILDEINNRIV